MSKWPLVKRQFLVYFFYFNFFFFCFFWFFLGTMYFNSEPSWRLFSIKNQLTFPKISIYFVIELFFFFFFLLIIMCRTVGKWHDNKPFWNSILSEINFVVVTSLGEFVFFSTRISKSYIHLFKMMPNWMRNWSQKCTYWIVNLKKQSLIF